MSDVFAVERRVDKRHPLATSIAFYHGPTQRDFPGRCVNISSGGLFMHVPPNVPVQVGHPVRMSAAGVRRPEFAGLGGEPLDATVIRVDRGEYLEGQLGVAIRFALSAG